MKTIYLICHAQSTGQQPDGDLTELGKKQAQDLIARLSSIDPDGAYSSPYLRALDTIRPYCDSAGLDIQTDPDLAERQLKPFDLWLPFDELMHHLRLSFENWDYKMEGGESLNDTQRRTQRGLRKIARSDFERPIVAAHGNLIAAVLGAIDPDFGFEQWRAMKNPHLYRLSFSGDGTVLFSDLD
ncbi:MAG: histidine phosphatase family protein [Paracoccaceae bacterium]